MGTIILESIVKKYSENITAVHDFNLTIEDREFLVLVGPSGCGKSTTLRMLAGLEEITSGNLYIGDKLVNSVKPKDRNIAMVFQNYALYPHLSVYNNMAFGLKMRKMKKDIINSKINTTVGFLGIQDLLDRKPSELSGGQRQRVALGRAMVREPEVFLLDEPLSNLDSKLRMQMRFEIIKLHKELNATFIYVTHDQTEAMTMADRIVVMKDGFIQQVDTPTNIYEFPANMFVAGFIGSPQMNFIKVKIKADNNISMEFNKYDIPIIKNKFNLDLLKKYDGKEVMMGIRPENIELSHFSELSKEFAIEAELEIKEVLGSEAYLHFNCKGEKIVAKVSLKQEFRENKIMKIVLDMEKIHLFDINDEKNILV